MGPPGMRTPKTVRDINPQGAVVELANKGSTAAHAIGYTAGGNEDSTVKCGFDGAMSPLQDFDKTLAGGKLGRESVRAGVRVEVAANNQLWAWGVVGSVPSHSEIWERRSRKTGRTGPWGRPVCQGGCAADETERSRGVL